MYDKQQQQNFIEKIYIIWYNENNSEMKNRQCYS